MSAHRQLTVVITINMPKKKKKKRKDKNQHTHCFNVNKCLLAEVLDCILICSNS